MNKLIITTIMDKPFIISIFCVIIATAAMAQTEHSDSIKTHELDEVVVEARTQRVIDRGVAYIPTNKIKKTATDATRLLELMNIPQLNITPGTMSVKTYTGKEVAMLLISRRRQRRICRACVLKTYFVSRCCNIPRMPASEVRPM